MNQHENKMNERARRKNKPEWNVNNINNFILCSFWRSLTLTSKSSLLNNFIKYIMTTSTIIVMMMLMMMIIIWKKANENVYADKWDERKWTKVRIRDRQWWWELFNKKIKPQQVKLNNLSQFSNHHHFYFHSHSIALMHLFFCSVYDLFWP